MANKGKKCCQGFWHRAYAGFSLVELMIAIAVLLIVFLGVYGAFHWGLGIVEEAGKRTLSSAIANEKLEQARNLGYEDVGVAGSYPNGVLPASEIINRENTEFTIDYRVDYIDNVLDGLAPADTCPNDYKLAKVNVSWSGKYSGEVSGDSIISPRNIVQECNEIGGLLETSAFRASGEMVDTPFIEVLGITNSISKNASPPSGKHSFILPEGIDEYKITVSKSGYSTEETFAIGDIYGGEIIATPERPHATVLEAQLTERSFSIDELSAFEIKTLESKIDGNIYYVRKVGSDVYDGLSLNSAFLTINKAASVMEPGDIVFVGAGVYDEKVIPQNSGAASRKIVYVADKDGAFTGDSGEIKIDGEDFGFYILGKNYIEIYGFKISDTTDSAVYLGGASANIKLEDNIISGNSARGIFIDSSSGIDISHNEIYLNALGIVLYNSANITAENNNVYQNLVSGINIADSIGVLAGFNEVFSNGAGILAIDGSNSCWVQNNNVYLNIGQGISIFGNSSAIEIKDNKVYSNGKNGIAVTSSDSNIIRSNLLYDNTLSGILLENNSLNNIIFNNTIFSNSGNGVFVNAGSNNNEMLNNIIFGNSFAGIRVSASSPIRNGYNDVYFNNGGDWVGISASSTSISADPLLVDPDGADNILGGLDGSDDEFYLSQIAAGQPNNSPCVDIGSDTSSALGMSGKTTRTDLGLDSGVCDLGFHYNLDSAPAYSGYPEPFGNLISNTFFHLRGDKIVGKNAGDDDIYKFSADNNTDGLGRLTISGLEWDNYYFSDFISSGIDLDLMVSWPSPMPIDLVPGVSQEVRLGLKAEETMFVTVLGGNGSVPIFSANAHLHNVGLGYDRTLFTNEDGAAYFIPVKAGAGYTIEATADGYQDFIQTGISIFGHEEQTIIMTASG